MGIINIVFFLGDERRVERGILTTSGLGWQGGTWATARRTMEGVVKTEPGAMPAEFMPASQFSGSRAGYVFKHGPQGLGYYRDHLATSRETSGSNASLTSAASAAGRHGTGRTAVSTGPVAVKREGQPDGQKALGSFPAIERSEGERREREASTKVHDAASKKAYKAAKKREKMQLRGEDGRTEDLVLLHTSVRHVGDLASSVMHRLDGKRRRLDARRIHGECDTWVDWHLQDAHVSKAAGAVDAGACQEASAAAAASSVTGSVTGVVPGGAPTVRRPSTRTSSLSWYHSSADEGWSAAGAFFAPAVAVPVKLHPRDKEGNTAAAEGWGGDDALLDAAGNRTIDEWGKWECDGEASGAAQLGGGDAQGERGAGHEGATRLLQALRALFAGSGLDNLMLASETDGERDSTVSAGASQSVGLSCEVQQQRPSYGTAGQLVRHVIRVTFLPRDLGQGPMALTITPAVPLDTSSVLLTLAAGEGAAGWEAEGAVLVGRAMRMVAQHLRLVHCVWEEIHVLQQQLVVDDAVSGSGFVCCLCPASPRCCACACVCVCFVCVCVRVCVCVCVCVCWIYTQRFDGSMPWKVHTNEF